MARKNAALFRRRAVLVLAEASRNTAVTVSQRVSCAPTTISPGKASPSLLVSPEVPAILPSLWQSWASQNVRHRHPEPTRWMRHFARRQPQAQRLTNALFADDRSFSG